MFHLELKAGWREPFDQAKLLVIEACSFMVKVYSISVHWPCATSSFGLASTVVRLVSAISAKAKCAYGGILTKTLFRVIYSRRLPGLIFLCGNLFVLLSWVVYPSSWWAVIWPLSVCCWAKLIFTCQLKWRRHWSKSKFDQQCKLAELRRLYSNSVVSLVSEC